MSETHGQSPIDARYKEVQEEYRELYDYLYSFIGDENIKAEMEPAIRIAIRDSIITEITAKSKERLSLKKQLGRAAVN